MSDFTKSWLDNSPVIDLLGTKELQIDELLTPICIKGKEQPFTPQNQCLPPE